MSAARLMLFVKLKFIGFSGVLFNFQRVLKNCDETFVNENEPIVRYIICVIGKSSLKNCRAESEIFS